MQGGGGGYSINWLHRKIFTTPSFLQVLFFFFKYTDANSIYLLNKLIQKLWEKASESLYIVAL